MEKGKGKRRTAATTTTAILLTTTIVFVGFFFFLLLLFSFFFPNPPSLPHLLGFSLPCRPSPSTTPTSPQKAWGSRFKKINEGEKNIKKRRY